MLFRRGDVFEGQVEVKSSGTSANPITYSAYGDGNHHNVVKNTGYNGIRVDGEGKKPDTECLP